MSEKKINEQWLEMGKHYIKPLTEVGELNIKTVTNMTKCIPVDNYLSAKSPVDLLDAHHKFIANAAAIATDHMQELTGIVQKAVSTINQQYNNMAAASHNAMDNSKYSASAKKGTDYNR